MNSLFISTSLFYIICVFNTVLTNESNNSSSCEIYASVTRTLSKEGFHRQLDYLVELTYFDSWEECSVCVEEIVPKGFYVNTDELTDLVRLGKLSAFVNETVDVELPWRLAKPHTIHVYTDLVELDNRLASSFSFPIHIRYHGAKIGGGGVFSGLNPPSVLLHCPKLACPDFNRVLPCSYTSWDKCLYKTLPNLVESSISVEVPVGNLDHYFLVIDMAAPTFGASSGLSFGAPPQPNQQAGFGFGTPAAATPAPSFGFGSPAAVSTPVPVQGGLSFGAQVVQQPPPLAHSTPGFGLGSPAPQATQPPLFGNGAAGAAGGGGFGGFGTPATTAQQTAGWLGGAQPTGLGAPAIVSTPQQSGFSFGTPTSTPATTQSSISFGLPPTSAAVNFNTPSTQTPGFFSSTTAAPTVGLFSAAKPTFGLTPTTAAPLFGAKTQASAPTPSLGGNLGGEISPPSLIKAVKDNPVPPEMMLLIKNFKSTIKQQKNCSSEVARSSVKPLQKTSEDIESVKHLLVKLERTVNANRSMNNKLKADTMRCVTDCEMAQRTLELSPGFQSDNIAPIDYFTQRAERFQEQVILLRVEIENTEKHIHSALDPTALSPQELNDSMKRLHECFVALAGRLQLVHSSVSSIKQSHLEIRRKKTNDYTDIFDRKQAALKQKSDLSTPGATLTASSLYSSVAALVQSRITPDQPNSSLGQTPSGMPSFGLLQQIPASTSMATPGNVELKSPPGSKRGKR